MALELLAQVLLDIGREYANDKAFERALARKEAEKLDERAYAKALREEQRVAQREAQDYINSKEMEQWKEKENLRLENDRKNRALMTKDSLKEQASLTGLLTPEQLEKASPAELNAAIEKYTVEKRVRDSATQWQEKLNQNLGENEGIYNAGRAADTELKRALYELGAMDQTSEVSQLYKKLLNDEMNSRFGSGAAGEAARKDLGGQVPPDVAKSVLAQMQAVLSNNSKTKALAARIEYAMRQANEVSGLALARGINLSAPAEGQSWWNMASTKGRPAPKFDTWTPPAAPTKPNEGNGIVLPDADEGDAGTAKPPAIDPSNPFFNEAKNANQFDILRQLAPDVEIAQMSDEAIRNRASNDATPTFFAAERGVDPQVAYQRAEELTAQRAAAQKRVSAALPTLDGYTAQQPSWWQKFKTEVRQNAFGRRQGDSVIEDQNAWLTRARNMQVKP